MADQPARSLAHPSWKNPWVVLASVLVGAFIIIVLAGFNFAVSHANLAVSRFGAYSGPAAPAMPGAPMRRYSSATVGGPGVVGTVTVISGNKLTVAGGGTTTEVDTSASTQYTNAAAAAVNDTVVATGTFSGSVLTATHITVNPQ